MPLLLVLPDFPCLQPKYCQISAIASPRSPFSNYDAFFFSLLVSKASTSPTSGLGTAAIVGILIVIFVLLLVAVDVTCYFLNKCGLLMCIAVNLCGKSGPGAKGKDMEEGKAAFS